MFSYLSKSIKSLTKGPRAILALHITDTLSEYFIVDPNEIESSLLYDTQIILKKTHLRKKQYRIQDALITLEGIVNEVIFSWEWSFTSSASPSEHSSENGIIQNTSLTINGLQVTILLNDWNDLTDDEKEHSNASLSKKKDSQSRNDDVLVDTETASNKESFLETYIQQIIDHLTLKIIDFSFNIIMKGGQSIVIHGNNIELETLGSSKVSSNSKLKSSMGLRQRLIIHSLGINVEKRSDSIELNNCLLVQPIVEPFDYCASVRRISGIRFRSGILSGLKIVGLPEMVQSSENIRGIKVHFGEELEALYSALLLLAHSTVSPNVDENRSAIETKSFVDQEDLQNTDTSNPTIFHLKFPSLTLVLPAAEECRSPTKIILSSVTVIYQADGKVIRISGQDGIKENENHFITLIDGAGWEMDVIEKRFSINGGKEINDNDLHSKESICKISIDKESVRCILSSIAHVWSNTNMSALAESWNKEEKLNSKAFSSDESNKGQWSILTNGAIALRLEEDHSCKTKWIEACVAPLHVILSDNGYMPTHIKTADIIFSSFREHNKITFPSICFDAQKLLIEDTVHVSIESIDQALILKKFVYDFMKSFVEIKSKNTSNVADISALQIMMSCIRIYLKDQDTVFMFQNLDGAKDTLNCESMYCKAQSGINLVMEKIIITSASKDMAMIRVSKVESFEFPGVVRLPSPLKDITLLVGNSTIDFQTKVLRLALNPDIFSFDGNSNSSQLPISTMSIKIKSDEFILGLWNKTLYVDKYIRLSSLDLDVSLKKSLIEFESKIKIGVHIQRSSECWIQGDIGRTNIKFDLVTLHPRIFKTAGLVIRSSSFGEVNINIPPITFFEGDTGSLADSKVVGNGIINIRVKCVDTIAKLQDILINFRGTQQKAVKEATTFSPECPIQFPGFRLHTCEEDITFVAESINFDTNKIICGSIDCSQSSMTLSMRDIEFTYGLTVNLRVGIIIDTTFPGKFSLKEPIKNTYISLEDNSLKIIVDKVNLKCFAGGINQNACGKGVSNDLMNTFEFPYPVHIKIKEIGVDISSKDKESAIIISSNIHFDLISDSGSITVNTLDVIQIRAAYKNEWLECLWRPLAFSVSQSLCSLNSLRCEGFLLRSCSFGQVEASIPSFTFLSEHNCIFMAASLDLKIRSLDVVKKIQDFTFPTSDNSDIFSSTSSDLPSVLCSVRFPELNIVLEDNHQSLKVKDLTVKDLNFLRFEAFDFHDSSGMHLSVHGINANMKPIPQIKIASICTLTIPEKLCLEETIFDVNISFEDGSIGILFDEAKLKYFGVMGDQGAIHKYENDELASAYEIPFPMHVKVSKIELNSADRMENDLIVRASNINIALKDEDSYLAIDTFDSVIIRVEHANEWLECSLQPSIIGLSKSLRSLSDMHCGGVVFGPFSFGRANAFIPTFTFLPESDCVDVTSPIYLKIGSIDVMQKILWFTSSLKDINSSACESKESTFSLCFNLNELNFLLEDTQSNLTAKDLTVKDFNTLMCKAVDIYDSSGKSLSMQGITINMIPHPQIKLTSISNFMVPGLLMLSEPIRDSLIEHKEGCAYVRLNSIKISILGDAQFSEKQNSSPVKVPINIPIQLTLAFFEISNTNNRCWILFKNMGIKIKQIDSAVLLRTRTGMTFYIKKSDDDWVGASIGSILLKFEEKSGGMKPKLLEFTGGVIGPCSSSCGSLFVEIPGVFYHDDNVYSCTDKVKIYFDSFEHLRNVVSLIDNASSITCKESHKQSNNFIDKFPFSMKFKAIHISVPLQKLLISIEGVTASNSSLRLDQLSFAMEKAASASLSNVGVNISNYKMEIGLIESLHIPNTVNLLKPTSKITILYKDAIMYIHVSSLIDMHMLSNEKDVKVHDSQLSDVIIPFALKLSFDHLSLSGLGDDKERKYSISSFLVNMTPKIEPVIDLLDDSERPTNVANISLVIGNVKSDLFQIQNIRASFQLCLNTLDVFEKLIASLDSAQISAGYSEVSWSSLFVINKDDIPKKISTPYARIGGFHLAITYRGVVASTHSKIDVLPYAGNSLSSSESIQKYYSQCVFSRVPGFLSNTEVLGANVTESTLSTIGARAIGSKSVLGAGVGGVTGIVLSDSVKGAIASGKKERNASEHEGYKFGDITRGTIRAVRQASKRGGETHESHDEYVPGDLTVGTLSSAGEYVAHNKSKLGSAAGSGVGSMVGLGLAGPLGFVAGSYMGGLAAGSVIGKDGNERDDSIQFNEKDASALNNKNKQTNHHVDSQAKISNPSTAYESKRPQKTQDHCDTQHSYSNSQSYHLQQNRSELLVSHQRTQPLNHRSSHATRRAQDTSYTLHTNNKNKQPVQQSNHGLVGNIINKGKKADGRTEKDGYKFGDFTRGFFS